MNRVEGLAVETQLSQLLPSTCDDYSPAFCDNFDTPRLWDPGHPTATFVPLHYEPGYAYPLVVWLHDSNLDEQCLPQVMRLLSLRNYVAVAPRGLSAGKSSRIAWRQDGDSIESATQVVFDAIEHARQRFNIHDQRIVLAGNGAGGTMALRIGLMNPTQFTTVVSLGGGLPQGQQPLRNLEQARQLPLWIGYGKQSDRYDLRHAMADLRLLHIANCKVNFSEYPDDELTDNMFRDINNWVMGKVCPATVVSSR